MRFVPFFTQVAQKQNLYPRAKGGTVFYSIDFGRGDTFQVQWDPLSRQNAQMRAVFYAKGGEEGYLTFNRSAMHHIDGGVAPLGNDLYELVWYADGIDQPEWKWRSDIAEFVMLLRLARVRLNQSCPTYRPYNN